MVASTDTDAAPVQALHVSPLHGDSRLGPSASSRTLLDPYFGSPPPGTVRAIERAATALETVPLARIGRAALMDRIDTKFLLPASAVPGLLQRCAEHYRILEVHGTVMARYNTRYFDTAELSLYHAHHAGRTPRVKVRVRTYLDSNAGFLEIKLKTNKARTLKARVPVDPSAPYPLTGLERESFAGLPLEAADLRESVVVDYTRLTLVGRHEPERLTLDLMLTFTRDGRVRAYPGVVVAEVKQARRGPSHFREEMRRLRLRDGSLSKYCLGIAVLEDGAKKNRFKGVLRRLEALAEDRVAPTHR